MKYISSKYCVSKSVLPFIFATSVFAYSGCKKTTERRHVEQASSKEVPEAEDFQDDLAILDGLASSSLTTILFQIHSGKYRIPFTAWYESGSIQIKNGKNGVIQATGTLTQEKIAIRFRDSGAECELERSGNNYEGEWRVNKSKFSPLKIEATVRTGTGPPMERFPLPSEKPRSNFSGNWDVRIKKKTKGVLQLVQDELGFIKGTMQSPEYDGLIFVEGVVEENKANMASFDGENAHLIQLTQKGEVLSVLWRDAHHGTTVLTGVLKSD